MKVLLLIIKQSYFDEIVAGKKKEERREVIPTTEKKYVVLNEAREITDIIKYDALKLCVGYAPDRDTALVEVKSARLEEIHDEADKPIFYEHKGEQNMMIDIVYRLGRVLEKNIA